MDLLGEWRERVEGPYDAGDGVAGSARHGCEQDLAVRDEVVADPGGGPITQGGRDVRLGGEVAADGGGGGGVGEDRAALVGDDHSAAGAPSVVAGEFRQVRRPSVFELLLAHGGERHRAQLRGVGEAVQLVARVDEAERHFQGQQDEHHEAEIAEQQTAGHRAPLRA
ncbi:hypothetical protein Scel_81080 [Streptomyces cellostaticus]|nr:hypothetical protein Scel_81080 [Streptomyces cellostaticus]